MSATRRQSRRWPLGRAWLLSLLSLTLHAASSAAPPRVLDRIPPEADAILAVDSVARLDQNTSQLLTAIELNAISTLSQALGAMGLRDGLDLTGSAAGVFFNHAEPADAATRFVLLLPVIDFNGFLKTLKAQPDEPVQRFEYAGATYFARDLGAGLAAFGPDRELVVSFDAAPGRLESHLRTFGIRGRELADRADLLVIADTRSLTPLLVGALGPLVQGAPGAGLTAALLGEDPRTRFASGLLDRVAEQSDVALLCVQAGPLGLRLDLAVPFRPGSELAAVCQAAPARPSGLHALPRQDYLFLGSLNLTHPGLRNLFLTALEPPVDAEARDAERAPPPALLGAMNALRSVDTASIAVYTPPSLMLGALTRTALTWEAPDAGVAAGAFREFVSSMNGQEMPGAGPADKAAPGGRVAAQVGPVSPPMTVQPGEVSEQWSIAFPPGAAPTNMMLFGLGPGPSGYLGATQTRGIITWSRDRDLFSACFDAARAPDPAHAATSDLMLSQVGALLPEDRCVEWYLNVRPALQQMLPLLGAAGQGAPPRLPDALPPVGASVSLSDGSLHAASFIPAPLIRVVVGIMNRINAAPAPAQRGQNARPQ